MISTDTSKADFLAAWPGGYVENFEHYPPGSEYQVASLLPQYANPNGVCLDLGSGGGLWATRYLKPLFGSVICMDVIPRPASLGDPRIGYVEVGDRDFSCPGIPDSYVNFVFSFGLFCHLSESASFDYLTSLHRVMASGAYGLIAFANWQRHQSTPKDGQRFSNLRSADGPCWFYCDASMAKRLVEDAGFIEFSDALPEFRDTLASFRKP